MFIMAEESIINQRIDTLPQSMKDTIKDPVGEVFDVKEFTKNIIIWKGVGLFCALVFAFICTFLLVLQIKSMPDYLFSFWLFIVIEIIMFLFIFWFLMMFFEGLYAQLNKEKYYVAINEDSVLIKENKRATFLRWKDISEYTIKRREHDNFITQIKLIVRYGENKEHTKSILVPNLYLDNFNKMYNLIYKHYQKNCSDIDKDAKAKSWPIVIGLSTKNEKLPNDISQLLFNKVESEDTLYFESKQYHFWSIFTSILSFVFSFGFIISILDIFELSSIWGIDFSVYSFNMKIFTAVILGLLTIGGLVLIVINVIRIIKSKKQILVVTKQGLIEKIFDIVYVIPWNSVKEITTKWFNYGAMNDKGELKIQLSYSEKPKGKATRIYNIQGEYHLEPNQLLNVLKEYKNKK